MTLSERDEVRYCHRIEAAAISGLILQPHHIDTVRPWLQPTDFTVQHYGRWYTLICEMRDRRQPIDQVTLLTELRRRDDLGMDGRFAVELAAIAERLPIPGEPVFYARAVVEESVRRQVAAAGLRLGQIAYQGDPAEMLEAAGRVENALQATRSRWQVAASRPLCDFSTKARHCDTAPDTP